MSILKNQQKRKEVLCLCVLEFSVLVSTKTTTSRKSDQFLQTNIIINIYSYIYGFVNQCGLDTKTPKKNQLQTISKNYTQPDTYCCYQ